MTSPMSAVVLLALMAATVDEQRPVFTTLSTLDGCPSREAFVNELSARTDRVRHVETTGEATAWVTASISRRGTRFEGKLEVRTKDGAKSKKTLQSPSCDTLTRAMTLTVALVLDPEGTRLVLEPVPLPPAPVVVPEPPAPVEPPPVVTPVEPPVVVTPPPPALVVPAPSPSSASARWEFLAMALTSSGVSGQPDFGAGARGGLWLGRDEAVLAFAASVCAGALSGRTVASEGIGRVRYGARFLGEVDAGLGLSFKPVRVMVGGFGQLGSVLVEGLDGDELYGSQRWLWAVGPLARVTVAFGPVLVGARVGAGFALRRESYRIEPRGVVFSVPSVALSAALEVGVALD